MEPTIIVSIITTITAISVSILSIILNNSRQKKTTIELEQFKLSIEHEKNRRLEKKEELKELLKIINSSLEFIQKIKDSIMKLVSYSSVNKEIEKDELKKIRSDVNNYFELFSKAFSNLDEDQRNTLHEVKSTLNAINNAATALLYNIETSNDINKNKTIYESLKNLRKNLSEIQQTILIRKLDIITRFNDEK